VFEKKERVFAVSWCVFGLKSDEVSENPFARSAQETAQQRSVTSKNKDVAEQWRGLGLGGVWG
jgi:hypothetical protein